MCHVFSVYCRTTHPNPNQELLPKSQPLPFRHVVSGLTVSLSVSFAIPVLFAILKHQRNTDRITFGKWVGFLIGDAIAEQQPFTDNVLHTVG
jgi:hypothetical protein